MGNKSLNTVLEFHYVWRKWQKTRSTRYAEWPTSTFTFSETFTRKYRLFYKICLN